MGVRSTMRNRLLIAIAITIAVAGISSAQTTRNRPILTNGQISNGLTAAIDQGIRRAVGDLGRRNGFYGNDRVKIPLPKNLQKTERALRAVGQGRRVDEFVEAMNRAAEAAVPVATDIFVDALREMTFDDVRNILFSGQDDSATRFFQRTTSPRLREEFRPIVERFTEQVGVTQKYKSMMNRYGGIGRLFGQDASDIDGYITEKALDGLFLMVADEERRIRRDPIRRTTAILRTVFGGIR